jgi:beta-lactamase class A
MITRRQFALRTATAVAAYTLIGRVGSARAASSLSNKLADDLAAIEHKSGGRLGVAVLDTGTAQSSITHRGDELFPMCSTFKLLAVGAILTRVDAGKEQLDRRITFTAQDLVTYSPITKQHVGGPGTASSGTTSSATTKGGMTLAEICAAALEYSDNTAANLLLASLGGPSGVTAFARSLGDSVTRLDRTETSLNEALPGDPRDTTTPSAMLGNLRKLALGDQLSAASRDQYIRWLRANTTGDTRLRAGLPKDWTIGDKTGSGDRGTANDVAIAWPPNRAPVLIAAYLTGTTVSPDQRNATIAAVGRAVGGALAG